MAASTSTLSIQIDDDLQARAVEVLAGVGLSLTDAVRLLLTRVAEDGEVPPGFMPDPEAYDAWFRARVQEALDDHRPGLSHEEVMAKAQAIIDAKRSALAGA